MSEQATLRMAGVIVTAILSFFLLLTILLLTLTHQRNEGKVERIEACAQFETDELQTLCLFDVVK